MTRKDYIAIAAALRDSYPIAENNSPDSAWRHCVNAIADTLQRDNSRFDRERFLKACNAIPG